MSIQPPAPPGCAVLASGGLAGSVLVYRMAYDYERVIPIYVRCGFAFEDQELAALRRFLAADPDERITEPVVLEGSIAGLLPDHWSVTGRSSPTRWPSGPEGPIPGRNLLLLARASVYCALHRLGSLALGVLREDPGADARQEFLLTFQGLTPFAVGRPIDILTPYCQITRLQVIRKGRDLPLHLTFSCIEPVEDRHCGRCLKCLERRRAFSQAKVEDQTEYADPL